ncbi:hypothetical protein KL910_002041 [Ogataea haglerorum]|nr:hypothetical protein KL945_001960 [Ogataea haglerorum]KAG7790757.1 hypothetical protein KL910_002041 [Ogataea haglerorum]
MYSLILRRLNSTAVLPGVSKRQLISPMAVPALNSVAPLPFKSPEAKRQRKRLLDRPGLIGVKRGMTQFYSRNGDRVPATVLEIDQVEVVYHKTLEKNGYYAVQVGYGHKLKNQTKAMLGHYRNAKVSPKEVLFEFEVRDEKGLVPVGSQLKADHFKPGQFVDVISKTKGKGFSGVMKRWNFSGLPASHGTSLAHRSAGSTGMNTTPARVLPGKKMAGHLGDEWNTIFNLEVLDVNAEKGYILVKGCVSGSNGSYVQIRDALKKYGSHILQDK